MRRALDYESNYELEKKPGVFWMPGFFSRVCSE